MVAALILAVLFVAIFSLLNFNLTATRLCRDNTRATQVLLDKMECLRLYQWQQLTNPVFLATNFTSWSYESTNAGTTNAIGLGTQFAGNLAIITPAPTLTGITYRSNLALVTVTVSWNYGNTNQAHTRSMSTYFSQVGMESVVQAN